MQLTTLPPRPALAALPGLCPGYTDLRHQAIQVTPSMPAATAGVAPPSLPRATYPHARILLVDDQASNVLLVSAALRQGGYEHVTGETDARRAVERFATTRPDLVLLDLHMPHLSGLDVLRQLRDLMSPGEYLPVLMLTADATVDAKLHALEAGAKDFLTKPFSPVEAMLRINNHLHTRFLFHELERQKATLEEQVRARTQELEEAQVEILDRLAMAAEYRDDSTGQHAHRVGELAARIAAALGLPAEDTELIRRAAQLHDLGKIGIPDAILLKPGRYTVDEYRHMQSHTMIGSRIVSGSRSQLLRVVEEVARTHHQRWDGKGYPAATDGCVGEVEPESNPAGEAIPLSGRIVAVADVYDALTHTRPYKPAWLPEDALAEIQRQRGLQFDPQVVDAFLRAMAGDPDWEAAA